jgi:hypothetical protein
MIKNCFIFLKKNFTRRKILKMFLVTFLSKMLSKIFKKLKKLFAKTPKSFEIFQIFLKLPTT